MTTTVSDRVDLPAYMTSGALLDKASGADIHLFFPPQWSPFQPFLSTPSLRAYLEPLGFRVEQSDLNVGFYEYFISRERLDLARRRLQLYIESLDDDAEHYRTKCVLGLANLAEYDVLIERIGSLRNHDTLEKVELFYQRIKAFESLLEAFSAAEPVVEIGHSSFEARDTLESIESIAQFVRNRHSNPFSAYFDTVVSQLQTLPRYFGISIIGSEQILPGLTLGYILKQHFPDIPIIVGGSVFSRLIEKTSVSSLLLGNYFDYVCRYEGERPLAAFLASSDPRSDKLPNLGYLENGEVVLTELIEPINIDEVPTPDFTGLPLESYFAPALVLPILSTRGCYWGKCAFCYHGMIYQDRYRMRSPELIAADLAALEARFGARHFAFNDEALPPKLFRLLPETIPWGKYFFTGLYKFEKIFKREHYEGMYGAGFRSLYIGLESASERVQKHMLKNNKQRTMLENLQFAHDAGIWNHTFNFFGFPTETPEEADETINFLLDHADIIHSEGTGTFSFEHNAPISHAPERFGVTKVTESGGELGLYYEYEVASGLDAEQAENALEKFRARRDEAGLYNVGGWIPREFLLLLLSRHERDRLRSMASSAELQLRLSSAQDALYTLQVETPAGKKFYVVNRNAGSVSETNCDAVQLLGMLTKTATVGTLVSTVPSFAKVFPLRKEWHDQQPVVVVSIDSSGNVIVPQMTNILSAHARSYGAVA
jgi:anaerobic magnesium-protoporphyrin IX monomethyl ester cyclase